MATQKSWWSEREYQSARKFPGYRPGIDPKPPVIVLRTPAPEQERRDDAR